MPIEIAPVNYQNDRHAHDLVLMLDHYATDPAGGAAPLADDVKQNLVKTLSTRDDADSVLAYDGDRAVGVMNCFEGFSTFRAAPLLNIHDIAVHADYRRRGIGRQLLAAADAIAVRRGCCKITLEVLSNNASAIKAYRQHGFLPYALDPKFGSALFMEKKLPSAS